MSVSPAPHLLTKAPHRPAAGAAFLGDLALAPARVHEACGVARHTFALIVAAALRGPIMWIAPAWRPERLNAEGIVRFVDPSRFLFVTPRRDEDVLWSMEEALRAGCVPLVVADLPGPPALTPVRRLHLAAETGAAEGRHLPLGLILTPEGNAPGVESRWSFAPRHPDTTTERWDMRRLRARTQPEAAWLVEGQPDGRLTLADRSRTDTAEEGWKSP